MTESEAARKYEATRVGPGFADPSYSLVERRVDVGVHTIHKETERQEGVDWAEGDSLWLNPEAPRSNKLVFRYAQPVE